MALARVKVVNPGDTILSADWNTEFNNILNNPISLISPTTGAINFQTSVAHTNLSPSAIAASSGGGLPAGISNVRGLTGTVTSSQTVTLSANAYVLQTTAQFPTFFPMTSTATFTVNVGTSGPAANGRDVGPVFSSTFVHVYAITTGAGSTTPAGIASTTPPPSGPVLPSGYSAWSYLGTYPYSSASTTFAVGLRPRGAFAAYEALQNALTGGTSTVETAVSLVSLVPALSPSMLLRAAFADTVTGVTLDIHHTSGGSYWQLQNANTARPQGTAVIPNTSQQIFYSGFTSTPNTTGLSIDVLGYCVPNGDV